CPDFAPVKPLPACPSRLQVGPALRALRGNTATSALSRRQLLGGTPPLKRQLSSLNPRGPRSGRVMLSRPSSLNRPHPPHSQAHRNFTAWRLIWRCLRCAGAPRRPASGSALSLPFLPSMSPSMSPGRLSLHLPSSFATSADLHREIPTVRPLPTSTISGHTDSL